MEYPSINQIVFTHVRDHLLRQGEPAADVSGVCRYRTIDGRSCAVGCLMEDEDYYPDFEGVGVHMLDAEPRWRTQKERDLAASLHQIDGCSIHLLRTLQGVHDNVPPSDWRGRLRGVAEHFGLEWEPEPEGLRL